MNSKTCKFLRNLVRTNQEDPNEALYVPYAPPRFKEIQIPQKYGSPLGMMVKVAKGIPRRLDVCGRRTYHIMKATY